MYFSRRPQTHYMLWQSYRGNQDHLYLEFNLPRFHKLFILQKQFSFHLVCLGESSLVFIVKKIRTSLGNAMVSCMEMWMSRNHTMQKYSLSLNEYDANLNGSHSPQTKKAHKCILFASFFMYAHTDSWSDPVEMSGIFQLCKVHHRFLREITTKIIFLKKCVMQL